MIDKEKLEILKKELNYTPSFETIEKLNRWQDCFLEYNSHTNLTSKNDEKVLFEKHVFDSLSLLLWDKFYNCKKLLDIGTGGGFPSVILAVCFPQIKILAVDSRIKKVNFLKEIKEVLDLKNLEIFYSRVEDLNPLNADLAVSRAVGKIIDVYELSKKHLSKEAKFIIYKSKTIDDELRIFNQKYKDKTPRIIPYNLPLKENFERNLVII